MQPQKGGDAKAGSSKHDAFLDSTLTMLTCRRVSLQPSETSLLAGYGSSSWRTPSQPRPQRMPIPYRGGLHAANGTVRLPFKGTFAAENPNLRLQFAQLLRLPLLDALLSSVVGAGSSRKLSMHCRHREHAIAQFQAPTKGSTGKPLFPNPTSG